MATSYLTYDEYTTYGGTQAAEATFSLLELKCRKRIDRLTACRVQNMETIPDEVKLCMVSLIEVECAVGAETQATNPAVTSYNTDGYSESYGNSLDVETATATMDKTVKDMLFGVCDDYGIPLLYRGLRL